MRTGRHILVLTLLATACWSERGAEALPANGPVGPSIVRQIAQRLTATVRSAAEAFNPHKVRREDAIGGIQAARPAGHTSLALGAKQSPAFQFRLPPPLV